jgi:hypothetical protein
MTRVTLVLLAGLVFVSALLLGAEEVKIVGRDYAFDAPAMLGAGTTTFVFENTGEVRHEMILVPLRQGVTEHHIQEAHHNGGTWRKVREQFGDGEITGILFATPGQRNAGTLLAQLVHGVHGRTYPIICQIEEPEGSPRHNVLGMYRTFSVE